MKLSEWKKEYLDNSLEVSKLNRQLAFAGIAVVWVFRSSGESQITLPHGLVYPLLFLCGSLGMDFLHNVTRTFILKRFYRREEKKLKNVHDDPNIVMSVVKRKVIDALYYSKLVLLVIAYVMLIVCLISAIG